MTLDRVRLLDRFYNPNREALGVGAILHGAQENAKFIAAKSRHHVGGVDTLTQPRRDAQQKLVSDGMTKCVVHFLEAIEIDVQQGQRAALLVDLRQIALESILELETIGKVCQHVEMGDVFDFARGLALLGHVLDHRDKGAGVGGLAAKIENSLADLLREHACLRERDIGIPSVAESDDLVGGHVGAFANRVGERFEFNWRRHRDQRQKARSLCG